MSTARVQGYSGLALGLLALSLGFATIRGDRPMARSASSHADALGVWGHPDDDSLDSLTIAREQLRAAALARPIDEPPNAAPAPPARQVQVIAAGAMVDGRSVDDRELAAMFAGWADDDPDTAVVLTASADLPHARIVAVLELAKAQGLHKLALSAP